ncbi:hypothetical protein E3J61_03170 [Candidatus Dependentiae bacterium]|nr:MAG: hypothetical protein E3J61_03170 [Candidatus Dependentiae bacterium]
MKSRIVVLYDGVHNPVFQSQVIEPLIKQLDQNPNDRGIIISFERTTISQKEQQALVVDPRIRLITVPKLPFLGTLSLHYATRQLSPIMQQHIHTAMITCRGPMAAWVVGHLNLPIPCIVQARGLAAQEYRYAHSSKIIGWLHRIRAWQYEQIEQWVYGAYAHNKNVMVQTVSKALRSYLIETFNAPADKIMVADHDVPSAISPAQRSTWRTEIRELLKIPHHAYVYVYNGSAKPWQCPQETVQFFVREYQKNPDAFLLVLTQDTGTFKTLIKRYALPPNAFHITRVAHTKIYRYLAAADAGMLLRKPHIINWVSRPTKALEYHAVGLKIIHNNTISMLKNI